MHFALIAGSFVEANTIWRTPRHWHSMPFARFAMGGGSAADRTHRILCLPAPAGCTVSRSSGSIKEIRRLVSGTNSWSRIAERPGPNRGGALDLAAWLRTLSKRNRQIATALSVGETTGDVARQYALSPGRISQLREWLRKHWEQFHGDSQLVGCAV